MITNALSRSHSLSLSLSRSRPPFQWLASHSCDELIDGQPPLHIACAANKLSIVKMLLKKGANVNQTDENQLSPLLAAAAAGALDICEYLITRTKCTPHICSRSLSLSVCLCSHSLTRCVCPSRTAGDTAQVDNKKSTPLLYIAGASGLSLNPTLQQKILTVLQEKGSSINAANIVRRAHNRGDRRIPTDTLLLTLTPIRRATERRDAVAPRRW